MISRKWYYHFRNQIVTREKPIGLYDCCCCCCCYWSTATTTATTSSAFFGIMMYETRVLLSFELNGKISLQTLCKVNKTIYKEKYKFVKAI